MGDSIDPLLWTSLITITGVWLILVVSPGPNFLLTAHLAASQSRRAGALAALGIAVGTTVWATVSLLGLGLLFQSAGWLYHLVKYLGAAYLIFLGLRTIVTAHKTSVAPSVKSPAVTGRQAFRRGILTDLSNPKAAAFFASLFAVTVPPAAPLWFDIAIVLTVVVMAGGWYAVVAWAVGSVPVAALYRRAARTIATIAGVVFVALGIRLAADR